MRLGSSLPIFFAALVSASSAAADWTAPAEPVRLRLSPRFGVWVVDFLRSNRACLFDFGCGEAPNSELGLSTGLGLDFSVSGPLYIGFAAEVLYTFAESSGSYRDQVIVPLEFSVFLRWPEWTVHPILGATINPILSFTDDLRAYSLGSLFGFGARLGEFGQIAATARLHFSERVNGVEFALQFYP